MGWIYKDNNCVIQVTRCTFDQIHIHITIQVQDYYTVMRFNDRHKCMEALYRLYVASHMLRSTKVDGLSKSHNYPKMQLSQMLMLEYWRSTNHVVFEMMDGNMCMFDEQWGEIFFSILGRAVLGDHIKSDFEHLDAVYKLLPVYRAIKNEIMKDTANSKHSLNWHHKIPEDSEEVQHTVFFFRQTIQRIERGQYKSYPVQSKYLNHAAVVPDMARYNIPVVYNENMLQDVDPVLHDIKMSLSGFFLNSHTAIWPEAALGNGGHIGAGQIAELVEDAKEDAPGHVVYGSPWTQCVVDQYAVTRDCSEGAGTSGIAVHKILEIYESTMEGEYKVNTFRGKELICHMSNHERKCVQKGKWRLLANLSKESTVNNWHVISYFKKLKANLMLPKVATDDVELVDGRDALFQN